MYYTHFVSKASTWKMAQPVALGIARHSLGITERTVSKSGGLHTVTQSGRVSISRSSLMVNATCNGPLRPITFTRRTLLRDSASRACSVMSVLYKKTSSIVHNIIVSLLPGHRLMLMGLSLIILLLQKSLWIRKTSPQPTFTNDT